MINARPVYIDCATPHDQMRDVKVCPHVTSWGDLVRIVGYPIMDFTPQDGRKLADAILSIIGPSESTHGE
jgi:hypothetical protein